MDPVVFGALLAIIAIAAVAIVLLRSATMKNRELRAQAQLLRPDPPVVTIRSPAFVATASGQRYHVGCIVGEVSHEYGVWTTRSHRVVETFDSSTEGWARAWALYLRLESDPDRGWVDHLGAPRSRREWVGGPADGARTPESVRTGSSR